MQMDLKCNAHEKAHKHTLQIDISFSHGKKGPFSLKSKTELGGKENTLTIRSQESSHMKGKCRLKVRISPRCRNEKKMIFAPAYFQ